MKHISLSYLTLFLLFAMFLPVAVSGHGTGQSLEKTVGDYVVDIGYDSLTSTIPAGDSTRFDFNAWNADRKSSPDFTDVWVRIMPQGSSKLLFASALDRPEFGLTGMTYAFPSAGAYELTVRFQKDGKALFDEALFPLGVTGEATRPSGNAGFRDGLIGFAIGLIVGFIAVKFLGPRNEPLQPKAT